MSNDLRGANNYLFNFCNKGNIPCQDTDIMEILNMHVQYAETPSSNFSVTLVQFPVNKDPSLVAGNYIQSKLLHCCRQITILLHGVCLQTGYCTCMTLKSAFAIRV